MRVYNIYMHAAYLYSQMTDRDQELARSKSLQKTSSEVVQYFHSPAVWILQTLGSCHSQSIIRVSHTSHHSKPVASLSRWRRRLPSHTASASR